MKLPNEFLTHWCRYGIINTHDLADELVDQIIREGRDLNLEMIKSDLKERIAKAVDSILGPSSKAFAESAVENWEEYEHPLADIDCNFLWAKDGILINISYPHSIVLNSPYFSYCALCWPLYNLTGDLNKQGGAKTFSLPREFYSQKATPLNIYLVSTEGLYQEGGKQ